MTNVPVPAPAQRRTRQARPPQRPVQGLRRQPDRHRARVVRLRRLLGSGRRRFPYRLLPLLGSPYRHHPGVLHLRGGLRFPACGRHHLRPARRPDRAQEGPGHHSDDHRRGHRPDRRPARLRQHRHHRAHHPGPAALRPGRGRGRRMGRRRPALQRIRRSAPPRLLGLGSTGGPARRQPAGQRRPGRPDPGPHRGAVHQLRLAHRVPGLRRPGRLRPLDPAQAGRHPHLQGHRSARRTAQRPGPRGLHARNSAR